ERASRPVIAGAESQAIAVEERAGDAAAISASVPIEASDGTVAEPALAEGSDRISAPVLAEGSERISSPLIASDEVASSGGTWRPTMPPVTPSVPWRRPRLPQQAAYVVPSLVIDDADPESADRERENRAARESSRLSFLPP